MPKPSHLLSPHDTMRVAVVAMVSPRTVSKHITGGRTHLHTGAAIDRALRELGFGHLVPGATMPVEVSPAA